MIEEFGEKDIPIDLLITAIFLVKGDKIFKRGYVSTNEEEGHNVEPSLVFHEKGSLGDLLIKYLIQAAEEGGSIVNDDDAEE